MGNMFATRVRHRPGALPVYIGSHLDTQPTGGKYDGVLGVLGGLEVIRTINDLGIKTKHPIVVTNWTNEEGARFAPAMLASGVFAGIHTEDYAYGRKDPDGKTFGDELAAHRLGRRREGRRAQDACDVRVSHRAGPDPRSRGQGRSASSPTGRACGGWNSP
jgi:acetylornithine deacetylase/succinyl-diaminopimelate desuccinylase-like protein